MIFLLEVLTLHATRDVRYISDCATSVRERVIWRCTVSCCFAIRKGVFATKVYLSLFDHGLLKQDHIAACPLHLMKA